MDWFAVAFFGVFAAVFGNACFKSVRRKREYRECKRMLAKLKRVSWFEGHPLVQGCCTA